MPTSDMAGWLARKYNILQQQADTAEMEARNRGSYQDAMAANAAAETGVRAQDVAGQNRLRAAQAGILPGTAESENALRGAQAGLTRQQTNASISQENFLDTYNPDVAKAFLGRFYGFGSYGPNGQPASALGGGSPGISSSVLGGGTRMGPGGVLSTTAQPAATQPAPGAPNLSGTPFSPYTGASSEPRPGYAEGTSDVQDDTMAGQAQYKGGTTRVPGKGDGKTDTVKAMLAPGEAVLNKAAAEHLGRPVIDLLNAVGQVKMGMRDPGQRGTQQAQAAEKKAVPAVADQQNGVQPGPGYAGGTSSVGGWIMGTPQGTSTADMRGGISQQQGKSWHPQELTASRGLKGYARGTSNVKHAPAPKGNGPGKGPGMRNAAKASPKAAAKAKAKAPSKAPAKPGKSEGAPQITPELLQAVMAMGAHGQGGGGQMPPMM